MKKCNKKVSGMTLIEVIISMLVFSIIALLMVKMGSVTKSLMMNTNHMNNKTNAEAPVAAVRDADALNNAVQNFTDESGQAITDTNGNPYAVETLPVTITVSGSGFTYTVNGVRYDTAIAAAASGKNCDTNMQGDLDFYIIEDPTEAPTT